MALKAEPFFGRAFLGRVGIDFTTTPTNSCARGPIRWHTDTPCWGSEGIHSGNHSSGASAPLEWLLLSATTTASSLEMSHLYIPVVVTVDLDCANISTRHASRLPPYGLNLQK